MNRRSFLLYFFTITCWSCGNKITHENEIVVFCASSLSPVLEQVKSKWEKDHFEKIIINAASSGILARQIENGAQADIFLSANMDWMDYLVNSMSINNQPQIITSNRLAVVVPFDDEIDSVDFNECLTVLVNQKSKISIGDPGHVPLGKYTKESLDFYKIYDKISSELILAKDARNALLLTELGEASFGFVYMSDAVSSKKVQVVSIVPAESHQPIYYQAIVVNYRNPKAMEFLDFISSEKTMMIWKEKGFMD